MSQRCLRTLLGQTSTSKSALAKSYIIREDLPQKQRDPVLSGFLDASPLSVFESMGSNQLVRTSSSMTGFDLLSCQVLWKTKKKNMSDLTEIIADAFFHRKQNTCVYFNIVFRSQARQSN